jgi:putative membrane protein
VQDRQAFLVIGAASLAALGLLFYLVYGQPVPPAPPAWTLWMPHLNAALNTSTTVLMLLGVRAIKAGDRVVHRRFMLGALTTSALFLVGYLAYHRFHGDTPYPVHDWTRAPYFFILISHIVLSVVVLPLLLTAVWFAGTGVFERHKRLARIVFPLWLYVSASGVLVYLFLRPYY